jgi:hypothetical protein
LLRFVVHFHSPEKVMFRSWKNIVGLLSLSLFTAGCQTQTSPSKAISSDTSAQSDLDASEGQHRDGDGHDPTKVEAQESKISAVMAKLNSEDRELAESQKYCAVMDRERLGGMGAPLKIEINGQSVFVCCKGCRQKALKNPDETLAKVAALKARP